MCFWRRLQYAFRLVLFLLRLRVEEAVQNGVALTVAPAGLRLQWARRASISVLRPVKLKGRAKNLSRLVAAGVGFAPSGTPTPLPAALPLFATGLAGLGLLGWRRKRKAV